MRNICRNGIRAVAIYKGSRLVHSPFTSICINGSSPFTIEIRFALSNSNSGILYSQEGGMEIGVEDGIPYFKHPDLGRIDGNNSWKLKCNCLIMIGVTYDGKELKMNINGFEVSSKISDNKEHTISTGNFIIGKEFSGYIEGIRVLSKAISGKALLTDYGNGFQNQADICLFQTDFTEKQYKDVGPDNLSIWRLDDEDVGEIAKCVNVVTVSELTNNGAFVRDNELNFSDAISVCCRIFPTLAKGEKQSIYSIGREHEYLSLCLELKEQNKYYVTINADNEQLLISKHEISGSMWHDISFSVDFRSGNAVLFIDGETEAECLSFKNSSLADTRAVVGAGYFITKPKYDNGFTGYLDYVAEFSKVLNSDEVQNFIEHEPYFYNEGIESLLLFGWGNPHNAIDGVDLAAYGEVSFPMVSDTCPLNAPNGTGWIVPQETDEEYWASLTINQQWALIIYIGLVSLISENVTGITMTDPSIPFDIDDPSKFLKRIIHRKYLNPGAKELLKWASGDESEIDFESLFDDDISIKNTKLITNKYSELINNLKPEELKSIQQITSTGSSTIPAIPLGGFGISGLSIEKNIEAAITIGAGTIFTLLLGMISIIKTSTKDRPINPSSNLILVSCSWNDNGDPRRGTIYFHNDPVSLSGPESMEWKADANGVNMTAVFVPSRLEFLKMHVKVKNVGNASFYGKLLLTSANYTSYSDDILINPQEEKIVDIDHLDVKHFQENVVRKVINYYSLKSFDGSQTVFMSTIKYTYFALLDLPLSPWVTGFSPDAPDKPNNYNSKEPHYVHTTILNHLFRDSKNPIRNNLKEFDDLVLSTIYEMNQNSSKLFYSFEGGNYSNNDSEFKLHKYIVDQEMESKLGVDCVDCANIVCAICYAYGVDIAMTAIRSYVMNGFEYNPILPIGFENEKENWKSGMFKFHVLNRSTFGSSYCAEDNFLLLYDACLRLNGSNQPGNPDNPKVLPPVRLYGKATDDIVVNLPPDLEYTNQTIYRERFIKNGYAADFLSGKIRLSKFIESLDEVVDEYMENAIKCNNDIKVIKRVGKEYGERGWICEFKDSSLNIYQYLPSESKGDIDKIEGKIDSITKLTTDLTNNLKSYGLYNPEGDEISCYIVQKGDIVYRFSGKKALEVANILLKEENL